MREDQNNLSNIRSLQERLTAQVVALRETPCREL